MQLSQPATSSALPTPKACSTSPVPISSIRQLPCLSSLKAQQLPSPSFPAPVSSTLKQPCSSSPTLITFVLQLTSMLRISFEPALIYPFPTTPASSVQLHPSPITITFVSLTPLFVLSPLSPVNL